MNVTKEIVTPKKAMEWLKRNVNNRPLRKNVADTLAGAMSRGEFMLNGETIKFNGNGDLIDGQHRLNAVIISGKSIETYVIRGVPHEAFDTFDQQEPRRPHDVFARDGELHYKHLATAARLVWQLTTIGPSDNRKMTNIQAKHFLEENAALRESVSLCGRIDIRLMMSHGQAAALHYMMAKMDQARADEFWIRVANGEGLIKSMPEYMLRKRMIENRAAKGSKMKRRTIMALAIKAWNFCRTGTAAKLLAFDPIKEEFPTIQ